MKGIAKHTQQIIEPVSRLDCLKGWTLVGGTALAIQLGHRMSEDLDFMRWQTHKGERMDVDWPQIHKELETVAEIQSMDILDHNHVEFIVAGVKFSFYARESKSPVNHTVPFLNHIVLADMEAIAAMKMEVMLRRSKFRDYYDLYCIFQHLYIINFRAFSTPAATLCLLRPDCVNQIKKFCRIQTDWVERFLAGTGIFLYLKAPCFWGRMKRR